MYFKQILDERCGCASYLIASRELKEAVIVDPSVHLQGYEDLLQDRGFQLKYLIDTHIHADHVSGARMLQEKYGAPILLHEFARGHVPQAVNLPNADLATRLKEVPRDRPLLLVCQRGNRSIRAAQFLIQMGFDSVASIRGGTDHWMKAGKPIEREKDDAERPLVTDSEWTHTGVLHQS